MGKYTRALCATFISLTGCDELLELGIHLPRPGGGDHHHGDPCASLDCGEGSCDAKHGMATCTCAPGYTQGGPAEACVPLAWTPEMQLGIPTDWSLAHDDTGQLQLIWTERCDVYARTYTGDAWQTPFLLESGPDCPRTPKVAMTSDGASFAFWNRPTTGPSTRPASQPEGVRYNALTPPGEPPAALLVAPLVDVPAQASVAAAGINQGGAALAFWSQYYKGGSLLLAVSPSEGEAFGAPQSGAGDIPYTFSGPYLDDQDRPIWSWSTYYYSRPCTLYVQRYDAAAGVEAALALNDNGTPFAHGFALSPNGEHGYIAWDYNARVAGDIAGRAYENGSWDTVSTPLFSGAPAGSLSISLNNQGDAALASDGGGNIRVSLRKSGTFGAFEAAATGAVGTDGRPQVLLDDAGNTFVVWQRTGGGQTSVFGSYRPAGKAFEPETQLSATVTGSIGGLHLAPLAGQGVAVVWSEVTDTGSVVRTRQLR
ncbi:MAG: hypothetical protein RL385_2796 [Pseudomonadota bacterium]